MRNILRLRATALVFVATFTLTGCLDDSVAAEPYGKPTLDGHEIVAVARGRIDVEGGLAVLSPAASGTVTAVMVKEGDLVRKGQLLLTQDATPAMAATEVASAELALANERLLAGEKRLPDLRRSLNQYRIAAREGAAQGQEVDQANEHLQSALSDVAVAKAEVAVAQKRLDQASTEVRSFELRALEDGVVTAVFAKRGSNLAAGTGAVTLMPNRPLVVRVEVNAAYVNAVRVGMRAIVQGESVSADGADAFPTAHLVRLSPVYGDGRQDEDTERGPVRVVKGTLAFDGSARALVGQTVRVNFYE